MLELRSVPQSSITVRELAGHGHCLIPHRPFQHGTGPIGTDVQCEVSIGTWGKNMTKGVGHRVPWFRPWGLHRRDGRAVARNPVVGQLPPQYDASPRRHIAERTVPVPCGTHEHPVLGALPRSPDPRTNDWSPPMPFHRMHAVRACHMLPAAGCRGSIPSAGVRSRRSPAPRARDPRDPSGVEGRPLRESPRPHRPPRARSTPQARSGPPRERGQGSST